MSLENVNILIVDDHAHTRSTISMMLRHIKVGEIFTAEDGLVAKEILDDGRNKVNMIICDWNMPHLTGIELLRELREGPETQVGKVPFLMITGRGDQPSIEEARDNGVSAYILKPFTLSELEKKLQTLIQKSLLAS